jgi:leucyl aminopeptidase (aminopeptidase T)
MSDDLQRAMDAVIHDCLAIREGEEVLVIANPATIGLAERLRGEAGKAGADAVLALMKQRPSHGSEPPASVAAAMAAADVALAPTIESLSHTAARRAANEAGTRMATLPGVTEDMLARAMSADIPEVRRRSVAVAALLTNGSEAHITCERGSDLRIGISGRDGTEDSGDIRAPGSFGNLPCGEGFIAPLEGTSEGRLVIDGSIAALGVVDSLVEMTIEAGHLTDASGPVGDRLLELLAAGGEEGTNVAELGIGTNEKATLTGEVLEDEKILGTCHVAFGASAGIGGTVQVPVHIDCVVMKPDVSIDGEPVLRGGELLV